jgi:hypothetical protein
MDANNYCNKFAPYKLTLFLLLCKSPFVAVGSECVAEVILKSYAHKLWKKVMYRSLNCPKNDLRVCKNEVTSITFHHNFANRIVEKGDLTKITLLETYPYCNALFAAVLSLEC